MNPRQKFAGMTLSYGKPAPSVSPPHDFVGGASLSAMGHAHKFLPLLLLILLSLSPPAWGYGRKSVGTTGAQFLKLSPNARAIGMGEAFSAVTDGSESIYWNPAALGRVGRQAFSLMHAVDRKSTRLNSSH